MNLKPVVEYAFGCQFLPMTFTIGFTASFRNCTCPYCGGYNGFSLNILSWVFTFTWRYIYVED